MRYLSTSSQNKLLPESNDNVLASFLALKKIGTRTNLVSAAKSILGCAYISCVQQYDSHEASDTGNACLRSFTTPAGSTAD